MSEPIPHGRGRWRVSLHRRHFAIAQVNWASLLVTEITRARGRRLEQQLNGPAQFSFTLNGDDPAAKLIQELRHDVFAWRWDEETPTPRGSHDWAVFHGPITQSEDQLTEQSDTVNFVAHDYFGMLERRISTRVHTYANMDQEFIMNNIQGEFGATASSGASLGAVRPYPMQAALTNPNGTSRPTLSGIVRDRTYVAGANALEEMTNLVNVEGGIDLDIVPLANVQYGSTTVDGLDGLRFWFPRQGETRNEPVLVYGATVSELTRTVNSSAYANYWRVTGNTLSGQTAPLYAERWNSDATSSTGLPFGLFMGADNAADVSQQNTLNQKAQGDLDLYGLLQPSYSLRLRPGAYRWKHPNMGDVLPLRVRAGRLDVNTTVRVLGIAYEISDDGDELVELTVGRPVETIASLLTRADRDVNALTRR